MRPVIMPIENFDALNGASVKFEYGGEASVGSLLKVYRADNFNTPVYTNQVYNMQRTNSIPPSVLTNGVQYVAEIISYHRDNYMQLIPSENSNKVYFWCFATPIFRFTNVSEGEIFNNQSFVAQLLYQQSDGVDISQFKYELYSSEMSLIDESDYYSDYEDNKSHNYNGLENNEIYYIRAKGITTRNQLLDTGYVTIFIQFEAPDSYSILYADADNGNGIIEYNTNIRLIDSDRNSNEYEYDAGTINLEEDKVTYSNNFVIDGDFIMAVRHKKTVGEILTFSNPNKGFKLYIVECEDGTYRYKLSVPNEICNYILYSIPFDMEDKNIMTCWIKRVNNLYELYIFVEQDMSDEYNLFLGEIRPSTDLTRYDVWIDLDYNPTIRIDKDNVVVWKQLEEPTENLHNNDIWINDEVED